MNLNESLTLLCEGCEIGSRRHNDPYWGHYCADCYEDICDGAVYRFDQAGFPAGEADDFAFMSIRVPHLSDYISSSVPYPWEVGYP